MLFKRLYSEVKFKVAVSEQHLETLRLQKKQKKTNFLNYMNYTDCVFHLDILLDAHYWDTHQQLQKIERPIPMSDGKALEFLSTQTGKKVGNVTWINEVDRASPYETGYKDILWNVSVHFLI